MTELEHLDKIIRERVSWTDLRALDAYERLWELACASARPDESEPLENLARAAVLWYWTCIHGAQAVDTPEHRSLCEAIESLVAQQEGPRTWPKAKAAPADLRLVEVEGYGRWQRIGDTSLFQHVGGVYKLHTFHGLRALGTVREVES
jgi:hypothetical protein